jgi:hypothetical protein
MARKKHASVKSSSKVSKKSKNKIAGTKRTRTVLIGLALFAVVVVGYAADPFSWFKTQPLVQEKVELPRYQYGSWVERAYSIGDLFRIVYTAGWEGANGAIGDAHLFSITNDSTLLRFHKDYHDMRQLYNGTWVDDRAWAILAEMYWWDVTGRTNTIWVQDAVQRYMDARNEGRFSNHEGYWSWYNWVPGSNVNDQIFTNSNMNQMATAGCWLYEATGDEIYLNDALLVWKGDGKTPGIIQTLYKGDGKWKGAEGRAAFGKELPWEGASYCSIGAALYKITKDPEIKDVIVATAKRIMDPANGWVDPVNFYQLRMDGNGAFVHFLLDAYDTAPDELVNIPGKVEKMLEHVWSNHYGNANVTLHRFRDHGIRNGWNPNGGEDGYGVNEVGTVHPQSQALRAFGVFAYIKNKYSK